MRWLTLTEFHAQFPGGQTAVFDYAAPICEQRLAIDAELGRSRAFTARTTLVHLIADTSCWVTVSQPAISMDLSAESNQYIPVLAGAELTVIEAFAPTYAPGHLGRSLVQSDNATDTVPDRSDVEGVESDPHGRTKLCSLTRNARFCK